jgi:hypothetical protein
MVTGRRRRNNPRMNSRLQLATRIHFLLLRELGEGIRIERLLRDRLYTRDVLLVCDALKSPELNALATRYREALEHKPVRAAAGAPQATPWAADTSGFGVSVPADEPKAAESTSPGWLESTWRWIGR